MRSHSIQPKVIIKLSTVLELASRCNVMYHRQPQEKNDQKKKR
jgi:hypothetical protein